MRKAKSRREKMKAKEQLHNRGRKSGDRPDTAPAPALTRALALTLERSGVQNPAGKRPTHLRHASSEWESL